MKGTAIISASVGTAITETPHADVESQEDDDKTKETQLRLRKCLTFAKFPRTCNIFLYVIFPMLFLNAICFVCGHILAMIEMSAEIQANDAYLRQIFKEDVLETSSIFALSKAFQNLANTCINRYSSSSVFSSNATASLMTTDLEIFLNDCMEEHGNVINSFQNPIDLLLQDENSTGSLTYDWMNCPMKDKELERETSLRTSSKKSAVISFNESATKLHEELTLAHANDTETGGFTEDYLETIQSISGHDHCVVHTAAGAFFWFTIMTTVGYGNTVPQSEGGRAMVYTLGFISILLFAGVSGQAGYVCLAIADDFFHKHKLKSLTKGAGASIFWLCAYLLWNVVITFIVLIWANSRSNDLFGWHEFKNAFWFSYISTTTVGFGDYFLHHEVIHSFDMLYLPMVLLLGFVFLANFLIKFAEWIGEVVKKKNLNLSIDDLSDSLQDESQTEEEITSPKMYRGRSMIKHSF